MKYHVFPLARMDALNAGRHRAVTCRRCAHILSEDASGSR
ncbi:hypothetical protein C7S16_1115 [Burkholderia thailandensis]|uniref:Uncharacterized protein n=1 Tax=Burkholderia thailandensis TaxID=57975 RepID=A0AAW9D092_BURTH|nr:hypothetical protein [Burkholderia thailandensis]MDW9254703.1 hypothetical protein [Burkholderia thailandensis]